MEKALLQPLISSMPTKFVRFQLIQLVITALKASYFTSWLCHRRHSSTRGLQIIHPYIKLPWGFCLFNYWCIIKTLSPLPLQF